MRQETPLDDAGLDRAADIAARAFYDDPFFEYLLPHAETRSALLTRVMGALMRPHAAAGGLYGDARAPSGILCVERPTARASTAAYAMSIGAIVPGMVFPILGRGQRLAQLGRLRQGLLVLSRMHALRPAAPHAYVAVLAVDPDQQRAGIGRALLGSFLDECDRDDLPCHLETSRPDNVGYYRRFGFDVTHELSVESTPPLWIMHRPRRG